MEALVGAFSQEKLLVGAFSVIVKIDGSFQSFAALIQSIQSRPGWRNPSSRRPLAGAGRSRMCPAAAAPSAAVEPPGEFRKFQRSGIVMRAIRRTKKSSSPAAANMEIGLIYTHKISKHSIDILQIQWDFMHLSEYSLLCRYS